MQSAKKQKLSTSEQTKIEDYTISEHYHLYVKSKDSYIDPYTLLRRLNQHIDKSKKTYITLNEFEKLTGEQLNYLFNKPSVTKLEEKPPALDSLTTAIIQDVKTKSHSIYHTASYLGITIEEFNNYLKQSDLKSLTKEKLPIVIEDNVTKMNESVNESTSTITNIQNSTTVILPNATTTTNTYKALANSSLSTSFVSSENLHNCNENTSENQSAVSTHSRKRVKRHTTSPTFALRQEQQVKTGLPWFPRKILSNLSSTMKQKKSKPGFFTMPSASAVIQESTENTLDNEYSFKELYEAIKKTNKRKLAVEKLKETHPDFTIETFNNYLGQHGFNYLILKCNEEEVIHRMIDDKFNANSQEGLNLINGLHQLALRNIQYYLITGEQNNPNKIFDLNENINDLLETYINIDSKKLITSEWLCSADCNLHNVKLRTTNPDWTFNLTYQPSFDNKNDKLSQHLTLMNMNILIAIEERREAVNSILSLNK